MNVATRPATLRPITIAEGVRTSALRDPGKVAFTEQGRSQTYRQFVERMNRVSNLSAGLGLRKDDHVALMSANCIEFIEITVGMAEAGTPAAMISPNATASEISYICDDAGARILFVQKAMEAVARSAKLATVERIVVIGGDYEDLLARSSPQDPAVALEEWDVFAIPYTSGTTGKPKGVLLSHRARVNHMLFAMAANYGCYSPACRGLAMAPFFNGAGFINAFGPIFFGGTCHILPKYEPEAMLRALSERKITNMFMVPTHFHAMFALGDTVLDKYDTSSLVCINSNAAPLPQATKERIVDFFGDNILFEAYGTTEVGGVTNLRPEDQLRKLRCVGQPIPGCRIQLMDDAGRPVKAGEVGEVWAQNAWMFNGYWNKPEQTAEAIKPGGWYATGDMGRLDDEGFLYLVDRKKDIIISGGQNIYPREIEEALHHHPAILEAASVGKDDAYWGEAVTAFVVFRAGQSASEDELRDFLAKDLARYKLPKKVYVIDRLPRNAAGKILHRELRSQVNALPALETKRG